MGAHAGTFFFDGRPGRGACCALRSGLEPIAPDGVSVHAEDGVAMAHGAFHVWAGESARANSHGSRQPDSSRRWMGDSTTVTISCCNSEIRWPGMTPVTSGIALSVFERWGIEGLRFLIGDWSLSIWDPHQRTLHLARDYMGVRPLYYCATDQSVMWSSSLGEIAQRAGRVDALSDEFVAAFMTLRLSANVTPYVGVRAVPTATCVSFAEAGPESAPAILATRAWARALSRQEAIRRTAARIVVRGCRRPFARERSRLGRAERRFRFLVCRLHGGRADQGWTRVGTIDPTALPRHAVLAGRRRAALHRGGRSADRGAQRNSRRRGSFRLLRGGTGSRDASGRNGSRAWRDCIAFASRADGSCCRGAPATPSWDASPTTAWPFSTISRTAVRFGVLRTRVAGADRAGSRSSKLPRAPPADGCRRVCPRRRNR